MKNFPSMEELMAMPLYRLKLLDISTAEEEAMVQTAINAKVQNSPAPSLNKPLRIPDIKTGEEEKHWQGIVDAEREKLRPRPINPEVKVKRFCEQCNSRGVRHKKDCPTLNNGLQNQAQNSNNSGSNKRTSKGPNL
jgi:hypothetical protein